MAMHGLFRFVLGATLSGGALLACAVTASDPYPDVATFCTAKATAECQIAATCAILPATCQTWRDSLCNGDALQAMTDGLRKYTPGNAPACIQALNRWYGGGNTAIPYVDFIGPGSITDTCERVFTGNLAQAASCTSPYDCANGAACAPVAPMSTAFICADAVQVDAGSLCGQAGQECATDTYCALQPTSAYACVPSATEGQPCSPTGTPCVSADRCAANGATSFSCEPRVAPGMPCSSDSDCLPAAPYCDPNAGSICTLGLTFAVLSADCTAYVPGKNDGGISQVGDGGAPGPEAGSTADSAASGD